MPPNWPSSTKAKSFFPNFFQWLGSLKGSELPVKTKAKKALGTLAFLHPLSPFLLLSRRPKGIPFTAARTTAVLVTLYLCHQILLHMGFGFPNTTTACLIVFMLLLDTSVPTFTYTFLACLRFFRCYLFIHAGLWLPLHDFFCWSGWPNPEVGGGDPWKLSSWYYPEWSQNTRDFLVYMFTHIHTPEVCTLLKNLAGKRSFSFQGKTNRKLIIKWVVWLKSVKKYNFLIWCKNFWGGKPGLGC